MRFIFHSFYCIILLFFLMSGCVSSSYSLKEKNKDRFSGKLIVELPRIDKEKNDKLNGTIKYIADSNIRISFRAPIVRTEVVLLDYTPTSLTIVDRHHKVYVIVDTSESSTIPFMSFDELNDILKNNIGRTNIYMKSAIIKKAPFSKSRYSIKKIVYNYFDESDVLIPSRYKQMTLSDFLEQVVF